MGAAMAEAAMAMGAHVLYLLGTDRGVVRPNAGRTAGSIQLAPVQHLLHARAGAQQPALQTIGELRCENAAGLLQPRCPFV